ncbi:hypothetical protein D3C83_296760 [compost metagenome]
MIVFIWLRSAITVWISTAHSVAPMTLGNSAMMPSPAVSMIRPPCRLISGRITV